MTTAPVPQQQPHAPFYSSSLTLGLLLSPWEYLVTINHSSLWQKHVAWAKPDGAHLKQYITGHYSSNMVLLSLLLTACINVFFNSSQELATMRRALGGTTGWHIPHNHNNGTAASNLLFHSFPFPSFQLPPLIFWIGLILVLDIFVTLMGIIATFTLWCMIAAISDSNAHCLLRSRLGQYCMSLPPRLVVASWYIFLVWSSLFVIELVVTPVACVLVITLILVLVCAIVIPLSAFGRLILDSGGMAQTPILPHSLEQQLLPSGLQASLLLRALYRQRRQKAAAAAAAAAATDERLEDDDLLGGGVGGDVLAEDVVTRQYRPRMHRQRQIETGQEERAFHMSDGRISNKDRPCHDVHEGTLPPKSGGLTPSQPSRHRRFESVDTVTSEVLLPHASILNSAISRQQLYELVESTMPTTTTTTTTTTRRRDRTTFTITDEDEDVKRQNAETQDEETGTLQLHEPLLLPPAVPVSHPTIRRPSALTRHHRRASSTATTALAHEWAQDATVRELYGVGMPAEFPLEEISFDETTNPDTNTNHNSLASQSPSFRWSISPSVWWNTGSNARFQWDAEDHDGNDDGNHNGNDADPETFLEEIPAAASRPVRPSNRPLAWSPRRKNAPQQNHATSWNPPGSSCTIPDELRQPLLNTDDEDDDEHDGRGLGQNSPADDPHNAAGTRPLLGHVPAAAVAATRQSGDHLSFPKNEVDSLSSVSSSDTQSLLQGEELMDRDDDDATGGVP